MKELISELEGLGFTNYEAKVFVSLMKGFNMSAPEVAEDSKVPKSSAYDILKIFAERGYCNEIQTPSKIRYEIVAPDIVKGKIGYEMEHEYLKKVNLLNSAFDRIEPIYKSNLNESESVDVELIKGFNRYRFVKFIELMKESKKEMLLMNKLQANVSQELDEVTKDFFKRGGTIKSIYDVSTDFKFEIDGKWEPVSKMDLMKLLEKFEKEGEEIRLSNNVPQNIAIFDREIVFTSLVDETKSRNKKTDIIIRNKSYAEYMIRLFELSWNESEKIKDYKNKLINE